ncbi:MAG: hypothetical protein K1X67_15170 [Fimbriimonadaceae bacterium]|nr:hypothetical protein [Fimbriimonadaceae bacterium]
MNSGICQCDMPEMRPSGVALASATAPLSHTQLCIGWLSIKASKRMRDAAIAAQKADRPNGCVPPQAQPTDDTDTAELKPRAVKAAPKKAKKRQMSAEGKLAIQVGVALRHPRFWCCKRSSSLVRRNAK